MQQFDFQSSKILLYCKKVHIQKENKSDNPKSTTYNNFIVLFATCKKMSPHHKPILINTEFLYIYTTKLLEINE